ncbi:MAG TPA: Rne/Rng family ribonuclease, partial [Microbacterium sp.]|nr:Rne/Rng family ribonuclease [Microbacterium sp.]
MADDTNHQSEYENTPDAPADEAVTLDVPDSTVGAVIEDGDAVVAESEVDPAEEIVAEAEPVAEAVGEVEAAAEVIAEIAADAVAEVEAAAEAVTEGEAVTEAEAETAAEEPVIEEKPLTAAALGLLPENFVSAVSTQLVFYAPEPPPVTERSGPLEIPSDEPAASSTARRRNRRRGGADDRDAASEAPHQPQQQQPQRQRAVELITEPQRIKGSTRLEAKKQRRRDGREAGRRRTVVTEAEFLARRESVDRVMIVRSKNGRIQIAVLEDKVLVEHYVARNQDASLIGNVYVGRVQNVLPSMEAAFVDIGRGRNAVLYSGEVDWDAVETGNQPRRIELALKSGDRVLVQVTKDPVGHKGARLTSQISLPGRYLVYVPGGAMNGISRKLPDTERARLKRILKEVLPESSGVIVRTAAEGATEEQLTRDVQRLTAQWEHISRQIESIQAPALLHSEPDLLVKIVRDVFNEDFTKMLIQGEDAQHTIANYLASVAPDLLERVEKYEGENDPFDEFRVTEQIEKALDRKVWLPSGGSLVIDRTEAMTVVDVNTGKFVGSGGNL